MMLLRLLNPQGIVGIATSLCLALFLVLQKGETSHWRKQSGAYEQRYRDQLTAFTRTVADYRAAAETARVADQANIARVNARQHAISERTEHDFEARLAAARSLAQRLRRETRTTTADPGTRGTTPVSVLPASSGGIARPTGENGLSAEDALTATDQAIQLDELIEWVKAQAAIDASEGTN